MIGLVWASVSLFSRENEYIWVHVLFRVYFGMRSYLFQCVCVVCAEIFENCENVALHMYCLVLCESFTFSLFKCSEPDDNGMVSCVIRIGSGEVLGSAIAKGVGNF